MKINDIKQKIRNDTMFTYKLLKICNFFYVFERKVFYAGKTKTKKIRLMPRYLNGNMEFFFDNEYKLAF